MLASCSVRRRAPALLSTCVSPSRVEPGKPPIPEARSSALAMKPGAARVGVGVRAGTRRGARCQAGTEGRGLGLAGRGSEPRIPSLVRKGPVPASRGGERT